MMYEVKISLPSHFSGIKFNNFMKHNSDLRKKYKFHINTEIKKADYWFVFEDLYKETEYCTVPNKNVIYLNNETSFSKDYFYQPFAEKFLNQFDQVYSSYPSNHTKLKNTFPYLPWMIHANHGSAIYEESEFNYDYLNNLELPNKAKKISVICSNKANTQNHSLRVNFLKILKHYFGDELHWYGQGIKQINSKHEGIFEYKYHLVLENDSKKNLISEKILDSYLGLSFPIYYGATNLSDYFDSNSFKNIDINDIKGSIKIIENIINDNYYEKNLPALQQSRNKVLNEYNFLNRIDNIIQANSVPTSSNDFAEFLKSKNYFWKQNTTTKAKLKNSLKRKLRLS